MSSVDRCPAGEVTDIAGTLELPGVAFDVLVSRTYYLIGCLELLFVDDRSLSNFVKGSKWSTQRAKEKIDCFYSVRTLFPEFFNNRDPCGLDVQKVFNAGLMCPLPNKNKINQSYIVYFNLTNMHVENISLLEVIKVFYMVLDVLLKEEDDFAESGLQMITDYENVPLKVLGEITPKMVKSFLFCLQAAYPVRFRSYVGINVPDTFQKLLNTILNSFVNEKTRNKITILGKNSAHKVNTIIDKSMFPKEMGGENGSLPIIADQWKSKMESYKNWFLEDAKYISNELLRTEKMKYKNQEFGIEGSFRKLNFD
ncbi:hypothetical protein FQR65_LT11438 [Abscondita terminalis]|nr:hypothetical protein FQR65_LT11438 [Abscondita terminalis]